MSDDFNNSDREEFTRLGEKMLKFYHQFPQNSSYRKIMAGMDDEGLGNCIMFFQGTQEFLNKRIGLSDLTDKHITEMEQEGWVYREPPPEESMSPALKEKFKKARKICQDTKVID
jgi:hypothetical protein